MRRLRLVVAALSLAAILAPSPLCAALAIYWQDDGAMTLNRAQANGTGAETIVSTASGGTGLAVDFSGGKVYWTTHSGTVAIQRSNLDGTEVEILVTAGLLVPQGIALDVANGKFYWADQGTNKISRANLDGTGVEVLVTASTQHPHDIDVDDVGGKMYWTDSLINKVFRADRDGTNVEVIADLGPDFTPFPSPRGLAVDSLNSKVYWASQGEGEIQRANLDGTGIETIVSVQGWNGPDGIAIDPIEGKIYWTGLNEVLKIQRSNLDGTGIEDVITSGLSIPRGIDVGRVADTVPEPTAIICWGGLIGSIVVQKRLLRERQIRDIVPV